MSAPETSRRRSVEAEVCIQPVGLAGTLAFPSHAPALVVFAHGSGSGRSSPRNTRVAAALRRHGLGTLLFDLLTEEEARASNSSARTSATRCLPGPSI